MTDTWFFGFFGIFSVVFVIISVAILPLLLKYRQKQKQMAEEEKLRKQQNKIMIEKEKFEHELMKQKLAHEAELEKKNSQDKFCQYCGMKIPAGNIGCPSCGSKIID